MPKHWRKNNQLLIIPSIVDARSMELKVDKSLNIGANYSSNRLIGGETSCRASVILCLNL